jgi:radical SAM protein with 4Fe4S-binding SPASM domain
MGGSPDEPFDGALLADLQQSYTASTAKIMDSWLTDSPIKLPHWIDILSTLLSRKGRTRFCGAGYTGITVACSGKVFPCYTLMNKNLFMGSVYDKDFPGENFKRVTALMRQTTKDTFPKCVKCWAKKLCILCCGDTSSASGTLSAPRERLCIIVRSVARAILLKVGEFMIDEDKWKSLAENLSIATGQCWNKGNEACSVPAKEN